MLFARPPGLAYLYGSLEKAEIERKEKQRREKIKVRHKGPSIYDVCKMLGFFDPLLSAFGTDLQY